MFLVDNNIKRDANKSSKYKTPFEVSDNDNKINIKTTPNEQGPIPQHCICTTTLTEVKFCSLSTDSIVLILTEIGECR
jgi:hypothetical protein